jgi:hypothetical protein
VGREGEGVVSDFDEFDNPTPAETAETGAPAPLTAEERYRLLLDDEIRRQRIKREAARAIEAEEHAQLWQPPEDVGSLKHWLEQPEPTTRWRFRGLMGVGHNLVIIAGRKAGKTTLINNLARSYVDGTPFLGRFEVTTTGRAVGIFNYEVEAEQYRQWLREARIEATDRVFPLNLRGKSLPLASDRVFDWVARWLRDRDIGLWIVDPWSRAYVGSVDNGNDEAQVGRFLARLDEVKQAAGVDELAMPVHTPKGRVDPGAESAIGSQRLEAWPDVMLYLVRDEQQRFLRAEGRDVDVPESPLHYDADTRALTLDIGGGSRAEFRHHSDRAALLEFLRQHPGSNCTEIETGLGWRDKRRRAAVVDAAIRDQLVVRRRVGRSELHWRAIDVEETEDATH